MADTNDNHVGCRCWRCWCQDNFTAVALFFVVILGLGLVVLVMHEPSVNEKSLTFLEGFVGGAFSTWTLALRTATGTPAHDLPPGTTQTTLRETVQETPKAPVVTATPEDTPKPPQA